MSRRKTDGLEQVGASLQDATPAVLEHLSAVRASLEAVRELVKPMGIKVRVLISVETPTQQRQWKLSTE